MKKKRIYLTVLVCIIISAMMFAYVYPFAKSEPVSGQEQTQSSGNNSEETASVGNDDSNSKDENDMNKIELNSIEELKKFSLLGGTTPELALQEDEGLGIAKDFSLFVENDITFLGADTEGKVAAGGAIRGTATNSQNEPYLYQIGMKNKDKYSADIVVGNGPVEGIALDFGYTDDGLTQTEDDKLVVYSSSATNMNLDRYTDEEKQHFVEADLINFSEEFERLREYSINLTNEEMNSELTNGMIAGNLGRYTGDLLAGGVNTADAIIFKGNDQICNSFYIDKIPRYKSIVLDVPYGSKVILNSNGKDETLDFGRWHAIYYPLSEEKYAEVNPSDYAIVYASDTDWIRENGTPRSFIGLIGGMKNDGGVADLAQNVLINLPNAENVELLSCGGIVLAPNADVTTKLKSDGNTIGGYLLGNLICKSYSGILQFGAQTNDITRKYSVNVSKIDDETEEKLEGAEFELYDSEDNKIYSWKSSKNTQKIELNPGTYTIKECKAPENYKSTDSNYIFTLNSDGTICNENGDIISTAEIQFIKNYEEKTYTNHSENWDSSQANRIIIVKDETGIDWNSVTSTKNTSDGGKIDTLNVQSELNFTAEETVNNKEISYEKKQKDWYMNKLVPIIKYNESEKVEWATYFQASTGTFSLSEVVETENGYYVIGGLYGPSGTVYIYVDSTQTISGKEINQEANDTSTVVIYVDKNGKIGYVASYDKQTADSLGRNTGKSVLKDGTLYLKMISPSNTVMKVEENLKFPHTYRLLYNGLSKNVGNITKISFEVDSTDATEYADRDLFMVVAENGTKPIDWMEFIKFTKVENGSTVFTNIPLSEEFYEYNRGYIFGTVQDASTVDVENVRAGKNGLKLQFYRQNLEVEGQTAEQVSDIKIKNITAYWKEVEYTTKEKIAQVSLKDSEPITIANERIKTSIKIIKKDDETKEVLKGATFGIYNKSSNELLYESEKTNEEGIVIFSDLELNEGIYYIKEIEAPDGYELSEEVQEFTVSQTSTIEFTFENKVKPKDGNYKFVVEKVNAKTKEKVTGAEFEVYEGENVIATLKDVDNDGTYESESIEITAVGTRTLKITESKVPEGYVKATDIETTITTELNEEERKYEVKEATNGKVSEDKLVVTFTVEEEKEKTEKTEETKTEEEKQEETKTEEEKTKETNPEEVKTEKAKKQETIKQVQTGDKIYITIVVLGIAVITWGVTVIVKEFYK